VALIVAASIISLNVAVSVELTATPVAAPVGAVADTVGGGGVCVFVFELPPQPVTMSDTTNNPRIRAPTIQIPLSLSIAEKRWRGADDELLKQSHVLGP
jgi:hypothetical protein